MPDARVQAAVEHWGPRFTQAGVDPNDFARTAATVETLGGLARRLGRRSATSTPSRAREAEAGGRTVTAGDAWLQAAVAYHFAKFVWVLDDARSAPVHRQSIDALYDGPPRAGHRRRAPGVPARRHRAGRQPAPAGGRRAVAAGHPDPRAGLDQGGVLPASRAVFLRRGMATLSLDGPGQGEAADALPIRPDYEVAVTAVLDGLAGRGRPRRRPCRPPSA